MSINRRNKRFKKTLELLIHGKCHHGKLATLQCCNCPLGDWCKTRVDSGSGYRGYIADRAKRINEILFDMVMNEELR